MSSDTYRLLAKTICCCFLSTPVHHHSDWAVNPHGVPLNCTATFFEYVIVDGKRYYASRTVGWSKSSFIHIMIPGPTTIDAHGEVLEIIQFDQDFH